MKVVVLKDKGFGFNKGTVWEVMGVFDNGNVQVRGYGSNFISIPKGEWAEVSLLTFNEYFALNFEKNVPAHSGT